MKVINKIVGAFLIIYLFIPVIFAYFVLGSWNGKIEIGQGEARFSEELKPDAYFFKIGAADLKMIGGTGSIIINKSNILGLQIPISLLDRKICIYKIEERNFGEGGYVVNLNPITDTLLDSFRTPCLPFIMDGEQILEVDNPKLFATPSNEQKIFNEKIVTGFVRVKLVSELKNSGAVIWIYVLSIGVFWGLMASLIEIMSLIWKLLKKN